MKSMFAFVLIAALAIPAIAGANQPTKGTKQYQSAKPSQTTTDTSAAAETTDVTKVEPAAGDRTPDQPKAGQGKSFKEEMRLPRKN